MCVCVCVCVCVCAHLLSWPPMKRDKTTEETNRGKWADNKKSVCVVALSAEAQGGRQRENWLQ